MQKKIYQQPDFSVEIAIRSLLSLGYLLMITSAYLLPFPSVGPVFTLFLLLLTRSPLSLSVPNLSPPTPRADTDTDTDTDTDPETADYASHSSLPSDITLQIDTEPKFGPHSLPAYLKHTQLIPESSPTTYVSSLRLFYSFPLLPFPPLTSPLINQLIIQPSYATNTNPTIRAKSTSTLPL